MESRKIIVTSALPYANGDIHLGHLVEYVQTDFWVRFQKMRGHRCVYVCADDTHGTPIMVRARKEGITPEELIARSYEQHTRDFAGFEINFDNYYSTNSPENYEFCKDIFARLESAGAYLTNSIKQLYCPNCKMFLPDRFVKGVCPKCGAGEQYGDSCDACGSTYTTADLKDAHCATCGCRDLELRESKHILFDLAKYKEYLRGWLDGHTPQDVAKKLREWFGDDQELLPWDVSRDAPYFGFEIPGHPGKYFYVWLDAPVGYLASLKNWCDRNGEKFEDWWGNPSAERYHFIGKDIVRFHCLFWPAELHAAGYEGPTKVFVHGFLTVNGEKMSKSKGTFIKAATYLKYLKAQDLRFYYACKLNGSTDDIDLNLDDFANRVNSDLVGKITNLASRGAQMLHKNLDGQLGEMDEAGRKLWQDALARSEEIAADYEARDFSKVMTEVRALADAANQYFDSMSPWKLVKTDPEAARKVLTSILNVFRVLTVYLTPVLPSYSLKVSKLFGEGPYQWADAAKAMENRPVEKYEYLATRIDKAAIDSLVEASKDTLAAAEAAPKPLIDPVKPTIDFDTFAKADLRVAKVVSAEAVEGSDKLIRLMLDIGEAKPRQVFAGIRKAYDPALLVGRSLVMVANLAPRKMRFGISEGMVLAAGNPDGSLFVSSPDSGAIPGASVR
ncbi:MAG: methionine--tRNA ligase [Kiritimatiellae bacterium]|nr:methionine--tRNA ligase [Kiritimatiellia bacterium]